ncbi:hypothetical protein D3OALGA1CA_4599 [Olavius algarvensis associated proteobacterium Delta 3]|nr:hypothetical protein D3OALGA1CA_4599 [Olavius algarvensis associated proteobacterium Delta 3]
MAAPEPWKIVVIDDEEGIRRVMRITLEDAGYTVVTAPDGQAGLGLCSEMSPQIVITDIRMPGMDGLQVLETVKQRFPDIEVIVVTAFGEMDLAIQALQLDASDFITKPIDNDILFIALDRARHRHATQQQIKDYTRYLENGWAETTQELMETFAFQRNLIESSMDGIMGLDAEGQVLTFNRSLEQMLGYTKGEVLHTLKIDGFFPDGGADKFKSYLVSDAYGGKNHLPLYETMLSDNAGKHIPVQITATRLFENDADAGMVLFIRDLRELQRLEREMADQAKILHQDKMMSLGRLAASVVHEINNPLAGILNYLRLMIRILKRGPLQGDGQQKFQNYLELVESETDRCSRIISNLLTFSRKTPPSKGDVRIDELIQRCILLSRHKLELSHITLESDIEPDIPIIRGDINQIQQCLINLIFNAIDAMPEGGDLTLTAKADRGTDRVRLGVSDTGPGISDVDLPRIFEPFFTTKSEGFGVGLGLSTVYGIIEDHGGEMDVDTGPGKGTTFWLLFPAGTRTAAPEA